MRRHAKAIVAISALLLLTCALGVNLAAATAPVVSIDPAPTASYTTAQVSGTVNPEDQETYFYFQYAIDPDTEGWSTGPEAYSVVLAPGSGPTPVSETLTALKPGATYEVRLVAENFVDPAQTTSAEPNPTFTTEAVGAPSVAIDPVSTFTATTAHFSGTIDPEAPIGNPSAFDVSWRFECTPECPGLQGGTIPADSTSHVVEAETSGLEPNTDYEVTLIAENAGGPTSAGPVSFKTPAVAPTVQTLYAGSLDADSAVLAARVNPKNSPVSYQFEWGSGGSFANVAPATPQVLGAEDNAFHVVTAPVSGLQPGTNYRFRVVATNSETSVASTGADHSFTTLELAGPPTPCANAAVRAQQGALHLSECRAYELITPPEKEFGFNGTGTGQGIAVSSPNGDAVAFKTLGPLSGAESASIKDPFSIGNRGDSDWSYRPISPPQVPQAGQSGSFPKFLNFSPDLSKAVILTSDPPLVPAAQPGIAYLYIRDLFEDGVFDGSYRLVSPVPQPGFMGIDKSLGFAGASADYSHLVFETENGNTFSYAPDAPLFGVQRNVYEFTGGQARLVSILPDGQPSPSGGTAGNGGPSGNGGGEFGSIQGAISSDGSRIFFTTAGSQQLYLRENGTTTVHVSASQAQVPDPNGPRAATFHAASPDGSSVIFTSKEELTDDANTGEDDSGNQTGAGADLYRYDVESGELTDLTVATDPADDAAGADVLGTLGISEDTSTIYFVARGNLAEGAVSGEPNLYLSRNGETEFIATLDDADNDVDKGNWNPFMTRRTSRVTPDGGHLLFTSIASLTGYDNRDAASGDPLAQIYRFEAASGELECVSCDPEGERPTAPSNIATDGSSEQTTHLKRNLSDDGRRAFFETGNALVPEDTNGRQDVYAWSDGEISIVSSPTAGRDSFFSDASADGSTVFFGTMAHLLPADVDALADLYAARVGGGFPEPPPPPSPCQGEGCQGPAANPPAPASAGSAAFSGPANPKARAKKKVRRCAGGKAKRRGKCVKKASRKKQASKNRASNERRASR